MFIIISSPPRYPEKTPKWDMLDATRLRRDIATAGPSCRLHSWKVSRARVSIKLDALDIDIAVMRGAPQLEQDKLAGPIERQRYARCEM